MAFETLIGDSITEAVRWLNKGQLVGIPTETVYGLAGNGLDTEAVTRIFEAKNRPYFDPLILHFKDAESVYGSVKEFSEEAKKLADHFWPGPLTLILPKNETVPDLVTSGSSGVAVRVPAHALTLQLLEQLDFPLAAPSANPFKYVSPTTAQHVFDQLQGKIPYVLEGGASHIGIESTIVSFLNETPRILRLGGIPVEEIQEIIPQTVVDIQYAPDAHESPGQLEHHYAPNCELKPLESSEFEQESGDYALLYFRKPIHTERHPSFYLSENGDLREAASRLFSLLRQFDQSHIKKVYFEWVPNEGLGRAINDRLSRASSHFRTKKD
jgi:L-threonylcarbamoyladenylate synthase